MIQSFQLLSKLIFVPGYLVQSGGLFSAFSFGKVVLIYTADSKVLGFKNKKGLLKPVLAGDVAHLYSAGIPLACGPGSNSNTITNKTKTKATKSFLKMKI